MTCAATGLSLALKFKDKRVVEGQLARLAGSRRIPVAQLSGCWSEQVHVHSLPQQAHQAALQGEPAPVRHCEWLHHATVQYH